ncbi:MAG: purine nucleoside permease [Pseudoxanthomonas sp.]
MPVIRLRSLLSSLLLLPALAIAAIPPAPEPAHRIPVKLVVVANFENGADSGDKPGEYQFWVERDQLDELIPVRGAARGVRRNARGEYGLLLQDMDAFVLDPRFDLSHAYWLFTGISGGDPNLLSVGSAAWARWVVNGDQLREFDDREIPAGWPYGLFAIGALKPNTLPSDPNGFGSVESADQLGMAWKLNPGLVGWAYALTREVRIPDTPVLAERRKAWVGFPEAQKPPRVLLGETLGSKRYWHGAMRNQWAEDWVKLWTGGKGRFAMTNMESQNAAERVERYAKMGFLDAQRVLVLRTASNPSMPPPGQDPLATVGDETPGQVAAYEANYRVGEPVVRALLDGWERYRDATPSAPLP